MTAYGDYAELGSSIQIERESPLSLREITLALRRHKRLIVLSGLIGFAISSAAILSLSPVYTAESSIVLDARRPRLVDLPSVVAEQTNAPEVAELRSEVEVLQSESLARRVITFLNMAANPEFQHSPSPMRGVVTDIKAAFAARFPKLASEFPMLRAAEVPADPVGAAVRLYREKLSVANDGRSYLIRVQFRSQDPQLAARVVNAHVELYLADQVAYKRQIGRQASAWLQRELGTLQSKLRVAEEAVQLFREQNQIVQTGGTTLLAQKLSAVNAQIPVAEGERASHESRLRQARDLLQRGSVETDTQVLDSPIVQRLREHEATLQRRLADLQTSYGDQYPAVAKIQAELRDVREGIKLAVFRVVKGIENEVQVARTRENELRARLAQLEALSVAAGREEGKLRDLEREAAANRSLIEVLLNRYKQVSAQDEIQQADARVVSTASTPAGPSFPKLQSLLPVALAGSLLLGVILAFLRELSRRGFKGSNEIEAECELPSLGSVPIVPRSWMRIFSPHDLVIDKPRSSYTEAIRCVRNSIQAGFAYDDAPRTLLVTSSLANEGKTTLAVALARSFAISGKRTLLIDCDLRNPSVNLLLGGGAQPIGADLVAVLERRAYSIDAIQKDQKSGLEFIGGSRSAVVPHDLISSGAMRQLIDHCRRHYDVVIIDSPPITAVSDALTLSRCVDATMLVVRWGVTPKEIAKTSLNKLFAHNARLCGVVLSRVDMRRGVFSPAELEYYHKQNLPYYQQ